MSALFPAENWFYHYFNFTESVDNVKNQIEVNEYDDHSEIYCKANNKIFDCGKFQIRDIPSFRYLYNQKRGGGKFHVLKGKGMASKHFELIDVLNQQNLPEFNGATFLAASNFNCLELSSAKSSPANGISGYSRDLTQGPTLAASSIASTVYRNYFVKHGDNHVGQLEKEINLLERTPIKIVHGKAIIDEESEIINNFNFNDENLYQIGLHTNCHVITSRANYLQLIDTTKNNQIVHQVYAASFSLGRYVKRTPKNIEILKNLITAEYKATILAAWENSIKFPGKLGSNKCILTLLGTGAFDNPIDLIAQCICSLVDLIIESGLEVYVVCYTEHIFNKSIPFFQKVVDATSGQIIEA